MARPLAAPAQLGAPRLASRGVLPWLVLLALTAALVLASEAAPWAFKYPAAWVVPLKSWINALMSWLRDEASFGLFTFQQLTRAISWLIEQPFRLVAERSLGRLRDGLRPIRDPALAADPLVRADRSPRGHGAPRRRARPRLAGGVVLPLSRRVRPVGECHGDALLDRDRGAARHRARHPARHRGLPPPPLRARDHAVPGSHADGAGVRLPGADPMVLRLQPGGGDDRDDRLRDAADGPQHRAGAAARAGRGDGFRPYGRLHAPPDDVEGAASFGTPWADGRRQPGDHAVAQHGDHRLDDRRGRARPRGAGGAAPARLRRRPRGGGRDHAARDRARPALAGVRAPAAARARRGGAELPAAPSASGRGTRAAARRLAARRAVAGDRDLSRKTCRRAPAMPSMPPWNGSTSTCSTPSRRSRRGS